MGRNSHSQEEFGIEGGLMTIWDLTNACNDLFVRVSHAIDDAFEIIADIHTSEIKRVVLSGSYAAIPEIRLRLSYRFSKKALKQNPHPRDAIIRGTAHWATQIGKLQEWVSFTSLTIRAGFRALEPLVVIPAGARLLARASAILPPNRSSWNISVYEGGTAAAPFRVGTFPLTAPVPLPGATLVVRVTRYGNVEISVVGGDGRAQRATLTLTPGMRMTWEKREEETAREDQRERDWHGVAMSPWVMGRAEVWMRKFAGPKQMPDSKWSYRPLKKLKEIIDDGLRLVGNMTDLQRLLAPFMPSQQARAS
jgi:hypothetical protein